MDSIDKAFRQAPRVKFLPESVRDAADTDAPLPIGYGQTNSQPYTVEAMLRWLEAEPGNKVLDVGSGSGWTTALLSHIAGPDGFVYAVEKVPELVAMGRENCAKLGAHNVSFVRAGKIYGLPEHAPYDRILVSASAGELPEALPQQLRLGGKMVIPVGHTILEITKTGAESYDIVNHEGFSFVPLVQ